MNDKKKNVELTDLAAEGAEDVKGGAASPTQTFASININTGISAGISQTIPTASRIGNTIDPGKLANAGSTVMCPW
jgi:hypothetical protein